MDRRIYLDHAATTPLDLRVLEAMLPVLTNGWGNPSSIYQEAREARKALDDARRTVAGILGAKPNEIVFTGGGSESDSLALHGVVAATRSRGNHVIISQIEHHAVLHTVQALEHEGLIHATYLPVDAEGFVDLAELERAVTDQTVLVSIMYANNEVGAIQDIASIGRIVKARNPKTLVHTDAVQAAGSLSLNVDRLSVDLLSMAAHKFYGPKGVGALYIRGRTPLVPQVLGGSQERDRRAGTENVAGAVGLAAALRLAAEEMESRNAHAAHLRDRLLAGIPARVPDARVNGPLDGRRRLPNNVSVCFAGIEAEPLLMQLDMGGVAASAGSACTTASVEPSHVLLAMGVPPQQARGSLRLTTGKDNTDADIDYLLDVLPRFVARLRGLGAVPAAG